MDRAKAGRPALVTLFVGALVLTACSSGRSGSHASTSTTHSVSPVKPVTTSAGFTAFITNAEDNGKTTGMGTVIPVNLADGKPGTPIQVGPGTGTNDLIVTADDKTAYASNEDTNAVTAINLATGKLGTPIAVGSEPVAIAFDPKTNEQWAWVADFGDKSVSTINLATGARGTTIPVPGIGPNTVAFTPDGKTGYVANWGTNKKAGTTVTPIQVTNGGASGRVLPSIEVGAHPNWIAVTQDGHTAFVANKGSNSITPIDVDTNAAGRPIPVPGPPIEMQISPDGRTGYVAIAGSSPGPEVDEVVPLDLTTSPATAGSPIKLPANTQPHWIAFTPDGQTAYVVGNGNSTLTAITVATGQAAAPIKVSSDPDSDLLAIAITPTQP